MKLETKLNHTPAPWQLSTITYGTRVNSRISDSSQMHTINGEGCLMVGGGDDGSMIVADIRTDDPRYVVAANARLIAAAPELLDALMKATILLKHAHDDANALRSQYAGETADAMGAALTKAIGETQE